MKKHLLALGLVALCLAPVAADQIFVRNKPFKGASSSAEGKLWVEAKPFAEALEFTLQPVEETPGKVKVGETIVDLQTVDGVEMVPLEDFAKAAGARVTPNKQLQTIDVNLAPAQAAATTAAPTAAKLGPNILRITGKCMPGTNAVGLFQGGSSTTPYKTGTVDARGNYVMDIDLSKDMHGFNGGLITDMRFFRAGAFEQMHGRCNFIIRNKGKLVLQVYQGPTMEIKGREFQYTESN